MLAKAYWRTVLHASSVPVLATGAETARPMQPPQMSSISNTLSARQHLDVRLRLVALVVVSDIGTSTMWGLQ